MPATDAAAHPGPLSTPPAAGGRAGISGRGRRFRPLLLAAVLPLALAADSATPVRRSTLAAVSAGAWQQVNLPATGSYFLLYVPKSWSQAQPAPLVVFLHGAGGTPADYEAYLFPPAEQVGAVVAAPKSSSDIGWGVGNDDQTVAATVAAVKGLLAVDPQRVSISGHSAGGAFAYLLAYGEADGYNAVFTLSAPFYPVTAVAQPGYRAPIHMYYGTTDPNYTGAWNRLVQQWTALGVPFESDIEPGYGHDFWPPDSMSAGFRFLVGKTFGSTCNADATHLCLQQGRFQVAVTWQTAAGTTGMGTVVPGLTSAGSGVFWFFDPANWEMLVKVLDGCTVNQRFWVFAAATTNVQYTLTVTDTATGQVKSYQNQAGQPAAALTDTGAFATCP